MVKGRRVKAVLACTRPDDCCSPNPKRRDQKLSVLQPNQTNTITAFLHGMGVEIDEKLPLTPLTAKDDILFTLMAKQEVQNEVCKTPVSIKQPRELPSTPHRIELFPPDPKPMPPKPKKKQENHKVTDFFPVRRSIRKTKKTVLEEKQKTLEHMLRNEIEEGLEVKIFADKGRGVVTSRDFNKGDFVVEYSGDLIDLNEAKKREDKYAQDSKTGCYMYYFKHNDQQYCVDATAESGKLGRLVNHSRNGNLITRTVMVDSRPRLVLLAKDDIKSGEEITYDYGDRSKESLRYHPWLAY